MSIELNLDPQDIERLVKDSIMRSGFGKAIEDGIKKALSGYNNPVDDALKKFVGGVAAELIEEHYSATIREAVQATIEEKVTDEMVKNTVDAAVSKMARAAEGY